MNKNKKEKFTDEEKERMFEEALEEIKKDSQMKVRIIAKSFLFTVKVVKSIISIFCILFGIFFVISMTYAYIHAFPADLNTTITACLYILGGILMILLGSSMDTLYYIF